MDDTHVVSEIKGEHSLLFMDWQDDVEGLQTHDAIHDRIGKWREARFNDILLLNEKL